MSKEIGKVFFRAITGLLKALWSLLVLCLHIIAKTIEITGTLASRITEHLLNKK